MSFRNSTTSIFRAAENLFYEPAGNELGMIKALISGINSGRYISTSVYVRHSHFNFTIANNRSCCEVSCKENTVHSESYQWWFALLKKRPVLDFTQFFSELTESK
jgi:hypothetical protein